MAATSEQSDSLLSGFDQLYKDFKIGIAEIQSLKSNYNAEMKRREALEIACNSLKQDNERLREHYTESLNNLANQLERRTKCESFREELKRVNDEHLCKQAENRKSMERLKQDYEAKVGELEAEIRGLQLEKATSEATISHLRQELAAHRTQVQALAQRLDQIHMDEESKYCGEIQDLRDCLLVEQEEKHELKRKLQDLEKELLISRTKLVEQQRDSASNRQVETLKSRMMKLRKENEILKRKMCCTEE